MVKKMFRVPSLRRGKGVLKWISAGLGIWLIASSATALIDHYFHLAEPLVEIALRGHWIKFSVGTLGALFGFVNLK